MAWKKKQEEVELVKPIEQPQTRDKWSIENFPVETKEVFRNNETGEVVDLMEAIAYILNKIDN